MTRRRPPIRRGLALALVLLVGPAASCGSDADGGASTSGSASSTSTSAPETTKPSTTRAPTSEPTTASPSTSLSTSPPSPVKVLIVGDSVGYTLAEYAPATIPGVTGVIQRALPGCGLLTSGPRPEAAVAAGSPPTYDDCAQAIMDADEAGLAEEPDVVLLVTGAWERSDHVRKGDLVGPGDDAWRDEVAGLLEARIESLQAAGPRVAVWVDPCAPEPDKRRRQDWYREEVVEPAAAATEAVVIDPAEVVCDGDEPRDDIEGVGNPRPDDGQHWSEAGAASLWTTWLGPRLAETAQR